MPQIPRSRSLWLRKSIQIHNKQTQLDRPIENAIKIATKNLLAL